MKSATVRASGETTAEEITKEVSEQFDQPIAVPNLPGEDPKSKHRTPGFARMRTSWSSEDRLIIQSAKAAVDGQINRNFADAYEVMNQVYDLVRTPEVDEHGEVKTDQYGFTVWARTPAGGYDEDFTRLSLKAKEDLLFKITTRLFAWSQRAADAWAEAMFAKSIWEERFSLGFDAPMSGTVDDRKAAGNLDAREERYFAIFMSYYSRRADAIVRNLELLGQRLKDSLG
jgi:hypothetical protein